MVFDLRPFVSWLIDEYEPNCRIAGQRGCYARKPGESEPELYGVADMACILHTIGALDPDDAERECWRNCFRQFVTGDSGYLLEHSGTHGKLHNTAFALAAMKLLQLQPFQPLAFLSEYSTRPQLVAYLESLDWRDHVYRDSHAGAGLASCVALVPEAQAASWFGIYFQVLDAFFDPRNGMMGIDKPESGDLDQIGGTFHYAFLYEYFHRRWPYPESCIDSVLGLQRPEGDWSTSNPWWLTLDAIYLATRSVRQCHHRMEDVKSVVRRAVALCLERVENYETRHAYFVEPILGVHTVTAAISIFAEAQQFLGSEEIRTDWPLRLVLDQRPFI